MENAWFHHGIRLQPGGHFRRIRGALVTLSLLSVEPQLEASPAPGGRTPVPAEPGPYTRHIPALDGLRGLAALSVVLAHVFPGTPHGPVATVLKHLSDIGAAGVDLFFVLSGFLITGILYDSLSEESFFRKFYARRALRIFPLYYGVILAFALAAVFLHLNFHRQLLSFALYAQNTYLITVPIFDYRGPSALPLSHFWTLAIEEQFYLVWPVGVFLLRKRSRLILCTVLFLAACPLIRAAFYLHDVPYIRIHEGTICRIDTLFAGAALALLLRSRFHNIVLRASGPLFIAGVLGFFAVTPLAAWMALSPNVSAAAALVQSLRETTLAAASAGLIALAIAAPSIGKGLRISPLRWLGRYSYGVYVFHLILFSYLEIPVRVAIRAHLTSSKEFSVVLTGLICLTLSIAAAWLSYNFYEKHFLRLKRHFEYHLTDPAIPTTL